MSRRIFLAEDVTTGVVARFSAAIEAADACSAVFARDGVLATRLTDDPRWRRGNITDLWQPATRQLMDWTRRLVEAQGPAIASTRIDRALLTSALEGRLRVAGLVYRLFNHCAEGDKSDQPALDLVADDPYARDAADHQAWFSPRPASVAIHAASPAAALKRIARERALASSLWTRDLAGDRGEPPLLRRVRGRRTALFTTVSQRGIRQMQKIMSDLQRRGWDVVIVHYGRALPGHRVARPGRDPLLLPFETVTRGWQVRAPTVADWSLDAPHGADGPISPRWLRVALDATWASTRVQVAQHQRMLERLTPDVVFGQGAEVTAMALHAAATPLGIPTIFLAHGYQHSGRAFYYFFNTAAATFGQACIDINRTSYDGEPFQGMVATGHPPHDDLAAMATTSVSVPRRRLALPGLVPPADRPFIVLGLASWGPDLLSHHQQKELFRLVARGLPSNAYFVCKLHPSMEERELCESVLAPSLPRDAYRVVGEAEYTTLDLLQACDVAISSERSMVLVDAIIVGCPAIGVHQAEIPLGVSDRAHPGKDYSRNCLIVTDAVELRAAILALTTDQSVRGRLLSARDEYLRKYLRVDGRAAQRIADLAEHLADGRAVADFSV